MCFSYEGCANAFLLRSVTFRNAIAIPILASREALEPSVMKGKSAMTKSMETVFSRDQRKPAKIIG